ncbi:MAG: hypothetical protein JNM45_15675 [Rhizobiales bacterium]|nr:hypothetical protein [Hyphomicrobiales bacterium]
MGIHRTALTAAMALALLAVPQTQQAVAGKTAQVVAGGLVGAAIVAAASKHHHHHKHYYYDDYQPYPVNGYNTYWNNVYSPAPGITCYRAQYACYRANGSFSANWTRMQFADGE